MAVSRGYTVVVGEGFCHDELHVNSTCWRAQSWIFVPRTYMK